MPEQAFGYCTQWYSPELQQGFAAGPPPKIVSPKPQFFGTKKACCLYLREGGAMVDCADEKAAAILLVRPKVETQGNCSRYEAQSNYEGIRGQYEHAASR
jgi:hypothetical protein